ncbi:MAG: insulinase family protein [Deltaproteobacteria bacterium]|nr:insulinase family protein [Deltaproteobacteria bacterium]
MLPKFRHVKGVLDNGLRVVTVELPHLHSAAVVMYAKVGSRYETPDDNGLSHFVEHMLFRGTSRYPNSYALNFAIEDLGGTLYAETGRDYSLYQISLDPELVPQGLEVFGDIFGAPAFTQIDVERQIILEEINEDLDDEGRDINLDDLARRTSFPDHPLGQKITGPMENVKRFSVDDVRRHFASFYGAENIILCVSGPVEAQAVMTSAARWLGSLPSGEPAKSEPPPDMNDGAHFAYVASPGAQTSVQLLFRALPESHPDYVALQTLGRVLDDGMSTRLHYTLCDQKGLAYYVSAAIEPFHDTAQFEISGAAAHAKLAELVQESLVLVGKLRDEPVTDRELRKAKRRYCLDLASAFDDPDAMAGWFGGTELFYPPSEFDQKVARMEAVTADDVQRVAQAMFRTERLVVAAAGGLTARQRKGVERVIRAWK